MIGMVSLWKYTAKSMRIFYLTLLFSICWWRHKSNLKITYEVQIYKSRERFMGWNLIK